MKRAFVLAGVLLLASASAALACSCTSGDGSCSASTNCPGGCYAICGASGCSSGCAGPQRDSPTLSFSGQDVTPSELQQRFSEELGVHFAFAAKKVDDHFTVDVENASAADLMNGLSKVGAAALLDHKGGPQEKAEGPFKQHFSLKADRVPTGTVSRLLGEIFGDSVKISTADPNAPISLDLENVTLGDLRIELPRVSGIKVEPPAQ